MLPEPEDEPSDEPEEEPPCQVDEPGRSDGEVMLPDGLVSVEPERPGEDGEGASSSLGNCAVWHSGRGSLGAQSDGVWPLRPGVLRVPWEDMEPDEEEPGLDMLP